MSNGPRRYATIGRITQPESMQLSDSIAELVGEVVTPIAEFEEALKALAVTSTRMNDIPNPTIMGEMLVVAAVASVEAYFRGVLSSLAGVCPLTMARLSGEKVAFGAAIVYPPSLLALALLERSLFSSHGQIAKEINRFLSIDVLKFPDFRAAIEAFDLACTCRHSVVHWRGIIDSDTLRKLNVASGGNRFRLEPDFALVQRVFAASDHLVHVANDFLFNITVRRWVDEGLILDADAPREESVANCDKLIAVFGDGVTVETGSKLQELLEESDSDF